MLITLIMLIERNSSSSRTPAVILLLLQFSSGNTLDFDELFIGVRSGPALYCFDVTNDDGSSSSMALMELKLKCLHKKSATCSTTNIPWNISFSSGTDEVRAKRDPSLCKESVNGHFWSNLCLNCIFKWT